MKALLTNHLPWIAPSIAIVLAASGFFDRSGSDGESTFDRTVDAAIVTLSEASGALSENMQAMVAPETTSAGALVAVPASAAVSVPVQATAPIVTAPEPVQNAAPLEPTNVQPVAFDPAPAPAPVAPVVSAPPPRTTQVAAIENPAAFFNAAQANLATQRSCVDDIRALARQARVYFPSGGVTGEESGLTQARLLARLVESCPGVTIEVGGHSDPSGNPINNKRLSRDRADAVISRIAAGGVDTSNFVSVGYGAERPSNVTGPEARAYYQRRVEFSVIERANPNAFGAVRSRETSFTINSCVARLESAVAQTKLFYRPGSVVVAPEDLRSVQGLAELAQNCPQARLRVVGQHDADYGYMETPATGRLRAVALMSALVSAGYDAGEIIIAAPSYSVDLPGQPGVSNSRIDFDVILEES